MAAARKEIKFDKGSGLLVIDAILTSLDWKTSDSPNSAKIKGAAGATFINSEDLRRPVLIGPPNASITLYAPFNFDYAWMQIPIKTDKAGNASLSAVMQKIVTAYKEAKSTNVFFKGIGRTVGGELMLHVRYSAQEEKQNADLAQRENKIVKRDAAFWEQACADKDKLINCYEDMLAELNIDDDARDEYLRKQGLCSDCYKERARCNCSPEGAEESDEEESDEAESDEAESDKNKASSPFPMKRVGPE